LAPGSSIPTIATTGVRGGKILGIRTAEAEVAGAAGAADILAEVTEATAGAAKKAIESGRKCANS